MTAAEFVAALDSLGWSQARFSKILGVHKNTVSLWATGELPVPQYAAVVLDIALGLKHLQERIFRAAD